MDSLSRYTITGFLVALLVILWGWSENGRYQFYRHDMKKEEAANAEIPNNLVTYTYWTVYDTRTGNISDYQISAITGMAKGEWITHHLGKD